MERWQQSNLQISSAVADEFVLMGLKNSLYYGLKETGGRIWKILEKPVTVHEIVDVLQEEYEVERQHCLRDVAAFLNKLAAESLIVKIS